MERPPALDLRQRQAGVGIVGRRGQGGAPVNPAVAALAIVGSEPRQAGHRPGLERERRLAGQLAGAVQVGGYAERGNRRIRQPALLHQVHRECRNVDAAPAAVQTAGRVNGGAATTERVQHQVALVRRCRDDPLQQRARLLRRVAEPFTGRRAHRGNVGPQVLQRLPRHFVQVALVPWHPARRSLHHAPSVNQGLHALPRIAPVAGHSHDFVAGVALRGSARSGHVALPVAAPGSWFPVAVEAIQVALVVGREQRVPGPRAAATVEQDHVTHPARLLAALGAVVVATGALPGDFGAEGAGPEHGIGQHLQVVAGGGVAVQVEGAGGLQQPVQVFQALGHVGQVGEHAGRPEQPGQGHDGAMRRARYRGLEARQPLAGGRVPRPGVGECARLRTAGGAGGVQQVVVGVGVERRVQVDQVHGGIVPPLHPVQAIAVAERVLRRRVHPAARRSRSRSRSSCRRSSWSSR